MSESFFLKIWESIEDQNSQPRYLRDIITIPYSEFSEKVLAQDSGFIQTMIESFYAGDVFILKGAFQKAFLQELSLKTHRYGKKTPSSFHKILDGCPDFHRVINPELAKKYAVRAIKHSHYFFPWNSDPLDLFEPITKVWRIFKLFSGYPANIYENNIPSKGVVDRIQVAHYPSGIGAIDLHSDPYMFQKFAISIVMSKRGENYKTGGAYVLNRNNEKIDIEDNLDIGDIYIVYSTIYHGVKTIDEGDKVDWDCFNGRWFVGLWSVDPDINAKRHTVYGVEEKINSKVG